MEVEIDLTKTIEENATSYYNKSKEARKTIVGLHKAMQAAIKKKVDSEQKVVVPKIERAQKWFEKYRWFFSSDGFLVVGGKDAKSNEAIVKKRMKDIDIYFHAEVYGAPHCFIQSQGKTVPEITMKEAAVFAVTFSKAWEQNRAQADAYSVRPEQVSKSAMAGEHLATGAFMIYGERNWFKKTPLSCAIGYFDKEKILMSGPLSAIKKHCSFFVELKQGLVEKNKASMKLKKIFEEKGHIFPQDYFLSLIPNGGFEL
jgi:predicted ribosome quality control (RQC) complex YloA/Tae2 family protein